MPKKLRGENKEDYLKRCVPYVINKEGLEQGQAIAKCNGMFSKPIDVVELKLSPETRSIEFISLVDDPAIESNWMAFSKTEFPEVECYDVVDMDKHIITGPFMIANKDILRIHPETGEEFYVFFSEETIREVGEKFMEEMKQKAVNMDHKIELSDIYVTECWFVQDPLNDKSNALGWKDITKGSWCGSMKVNNEDIWQNFIKTGHLKGFSIQGKFIEKFSKDCIMCDVKRREDVLLLDKMIEQLSKMNPEDEYEFESMLEELEKINNKNMEIKAQKEKLEDQPRLSKEIIDILNTQIKNEMSNSQFYRDIADWSDNAGYIGSAKYYYKSADEEIEHAKGIYEFLYDQNCKAQTPAIEEVTNEYKDLVELVNASLEREMETTQQWRDIAKMAMDENSVDVYSLSQKYLDQQVEEEDKFRFFLFKFRMDMPVWKQDELFEDQASTQK